MLEKSKIFEESYIKRVILLGSTIVVIVVSIVTGYILINGEIKDLKQHLKIFRKTLIQREKSAIKDVVNNLVSDIEYEKKSRLFEIKRRIKDETVITLRLLEKLIKKTSNKDEKLQIVLEELKKISANTKVEPFVYDKFGNLLFNKNDTLIIGENFYDLKDTDGKKFVKEIVEKQGFVIYSWFVPQTLKISKRVTYSLKFKDLDLILGFAEFLDTNYSLSKKIVDKISKEKLGENDFVFIYEILSLSSSRAYSRLVLEKNIKTTSKELRAIEDILSKSNYNGNIFYEYDEKLIYSSFLFDYKTFISAGVYLDSIREIIRKETEISKDNLNKKIISLVLNILTIGVIFFIFSYLLAEKIEKIFISYRLNIESSQKLLMQKSKMASMGEMIANITHQWRQPLTRLSGIFLDIESAFTNKELDKKYLDKRIDSANDLLEYMSKTIDDFREFYMPNSNKSRFYLLECVENALKIAGSFLKSYNVEVKLKIDKSLEIYGVSNEFSQVILNLLTNSKDIAISRDIENPMVRIVAKSKKDKIIVIIEDNCGGIESKNIDRIFEPYFTTKEHYGTGIGLYMCKMIIENKFGGKIFVKNSKNGVRFIIELQKS